MQTEHTQELLSILQSFPLEDKIQMTQDRIIEFVEQTERNGKGAYISFSGGKDSTVLLDIALDIYPDLPAVFSNTGLEYYEIQKFAKKQKNVDVVSPKMRFDEVISKYGYPLIGKEVAEAIYYARRMQPDKRERERVYDHFLQTSAHRNRRTVLTGAYPFTHTHTHTTAQADGTLRHTVKKRTEFNGQRTIRGSRRTGVEEKSFFNKEKWLPLCRDIPVPISHYCCQIVKKNPLHKYSKETGRCPIMATMAEESRVRKQAWMRTGCNAFDGKIQSKPMSFWTEQDVLQYIVSKPLEICSVYGDIVAVDEDGNEYDPHTLLTDGCKLKCTGCDRTGCIYCGFGFHLERGETRFQRLAKTHPKQYEYCMGGGQWVDNPAYDPAAPKFDGEWQNWNPKKIFVPSKKGIGLKTVFDMVNEIYGKDFYRYE